MFKISYKDLRAEDCRLAVRKLATCGDYPSIKLAHRIGKMAKSLDDALQKSQKEWINLADPLLEKEANGRYKIGPEGPVFKEGIDKSDAEKKIEEFVGKEVIIEYPKLTLGDVQPAKLSPLELVAIEPMLAAP